MKNRIFFYSTNFIPSYFDWDGCWIFDGPRKSLYTVFALLLRLLSRLRGSNKMTVFRLDFLTWRKKNRNVSWKLVRRESFCLFHFSKLLRSRVQRLDWNGFLTARLSQSRQILPLSSSPCFSCMHLKFFFSNDETREENS